MLRNAIAYLQELQLANSVNNCILMGTDCTAPSFVYSLLFVPSDKLWSYAFFPYSAIQFGCVAPMAMTAAIRAP